MVAPREPPSKTEPARDIGDHIHTDITILKQKSIGHNTIILTTSDEKSSFIVGVPCQGKSEAHMRKASMQTITNFNTYGHTVKLMTTDDEISLKVLKKHLGPRGVRIESTPAGLHEKHVENRIGTIKNRKNAMLASLPYELPAELEGEAYMDAITWLNRIPNKTTGPTTTPYQLFTGQKTFIPRYYFGQWGLFYNKKQGADMPSEWGIFIGYGSNPKYLRCYNPLTKTVTSKRRFDPSTSYPTAWNLKPRLRPPERKLKTESAQPVNTDRSTNAVVTQASALAQRPINGNDLGREWKEYFLTPNSRGEYPELHENETVDTRQNATGRKSQENSSSQEGTQTQTAAINPEGTSTTSTSNVVQSSQEGNVSSSDLPATTQASQSLPVSETSRRPKRSTVGSWQDGPRNFKGYKLDLVNPIDNNDLHGPFRVVAMRTSLKNALQNKARKAEIEKSIGAEIDNMEQRCP